MLNNFLSFEGPSIIGSCQFKGHENAVEILNWGFDCTQAQSPLRDSGGKAKLSALRLTKFTDNASDDLLKHLWGGVTIAKAELQCYRATGEQVGQIGARYLTITLEGVIVTKYEIRDDPGDQAIENIELSFAKITWTYSPVSGNVPGPVQSVMFDQRTNELA